ncbi:hypothetical protein KC614_00865 [candidate division WWE3 bacterium]|uniref:Uncharacterized protein n=1 Tax=candidate division WWE3 bacterium TaxID=2053526 RepID=A0A955LK03_UNCKA|nr:hypothetical protein [candidate division WWE3 bacterium]
MIKIKELLKQFASRLVELVKNNKPYALGVVVIILIIFGMYLLSRNRGKAEVVTFVNAPQNIDTVYKGQVDVKVDSGVSTKVVSKMPEIALGHPVDNWFDSSRQVLIADALGFSSKAVVLPSSTNPAWLEDVRSLYIAKDIGEINFSTAFNLDSNIDHTNVPSQQIAVNALNNFFTKTQLPITGMNLDAVTAEYYYLDSTDTVTKVTSGTGPLIRLTIPFEIAGVPVIMPIESYVYVDGTGTIKLMSLFIPNFEQTNPEMDVLSFASAQQKFQNGEFSVVKMRDDPSTQWLIDSIYPAYYINQKDFYTLSKTRTLSPVYIFSSGDTTVAVEAADE